jgi:hypothetical protein
VTGPFVEKSSGAKLRVFFGHDTRIYTENISKQGNWYVLLQQSVTLFTPDDAPRLVNDPLAYGTLAPVSVVNDVSRHQPLELRVFPNRDCFLNKPLL